MHRLLLIVPFLFLACCGPYTMKGRVIQGDASYMTVVDKDDFRLTSPDSSGIPGVLLKLTMDPSRLNRKEISQEASDQDGNFTLPVDEVGAGLLNLDMGLTARRKGLQSAEGFFRLPSTSKRVLIVMAPGSDPPGYFEDEETPREMYERHR